MKTISDWYKYYENIYMKASFRQDALLQREPLNWKLDGRIKPATRRAGENAF